ncbi:chemotaxis protein CheX [Alkalihalobacillus sp. MEB130]|uniref:chemotaxis protein CheX n=1 Tax=Alkalihalobacillus sp. MEB130 TaxID=2976704 RepID=UPI0028DE84D0|nr:chemotaxis protein CheX [Alkalihalobacillus sp. MEB130]MDT8858779.1 chemotaxis protein CheX [Alkalihalobacillus sp. MEB130]
MLTKTELSSETISNLLCGIVTSIKNVVPLTIQGHNHQINDQSIDIKLGVLIGITGDLNGKLILAGETPIFSSIGQSMFGMPLEGEMLDSFIGELGNMIAGSFSTIIAEYEVITDITSPMIMKGNAELSGFEKGFSVPISIGETGDMSAFLLLD